MVQNHGKQHGKQNMDSGPATRARFPKFPFLCLTVSGGHTQIVLVRNHLDMEVIGQTTDDAAGEAFDKAAKVMGLPYPGGPIIDKLAADGDSLAYPFPHPKGKEYNYSFSGLKTAFLYFIRDRVQTDPQFINNNKADICASIQHTIVTILLSKLEKAAGDLTRGIGLFYIVYGQRKEIDA